MNNNDNDFFDLSQIYNLDGRKFEDSDKLADNIDEIIGYNFFDEEEADSKLKGDEINDYANIIERQNLVETPMGKGLINKTETLMGIEDDLNILDSKIFNFKNINIKDLRNFLGTQTGKLATIMIGNDRLIEKIGIILAVGEDFLMIKETNTGNILICPLRKVEFIKLSEV